MKIKNKAHLQSVIQDHLDVSDVTDTSHLFESSSFNGAIDQWDVSNVEDMSHMFYDASTFNQPLDNWNVSNVDSASLMFDGAASFSSFESFLKWKVSSLCQTANFFQGKTFKQVHRDLERKLLLSPLHLALA